MFYEATRSNSEAVRKFVKQIYLFMADYILQSMLERWGNRFETLNNKREKENRPRQQNSLFNQLSETFNRAQLRAIIEQQGKTTPERVFICQWKKMHVIEIIDKDTFKKLNVKC